MPCCGRVNSQTLAHKSSLSSQRSFTSWLVPVQLCQLVEGGYVKECQRRKQNCYYILPKGEQKLDVQQVGSHRSPFDSPYPFPTLLAVWERTVQAKP